LQDAPEADDRSGPGSQRKQFLKLRIDSNVKPLESTPRAASASALDRPAAPAIGAANGSLTTPLVTKYVRAASNGKCLKRMRSRTFRSTSSF
jgi:hypothetical protein